MTFYLFRIFVRGLFNRPRAARNPGRCSSRRRGVIVVRRRRRLRVVKVASSTDTRVRLHFDPLLSCVYIFTKTKPFCHFKEFVIQKTTTTVSSDYKVSTTFINSVILFSILTTILHNLFYGQPQV